MFFWCGKICKFLDCDAGKNENDFVQQRKTKIFVELRNCGQFAKKVRKKGKSWQEWQYVRVVSIILCSLIPLVLFGVVETIEKVNCPVNSYVHQSPL